MRLESVASGASCLGIDTSTLRTRLMQLDDMTSREGVDMGSSPILGTNGK